MLSHPERVEALEEEDQQQQQQQPPPPMMEEAGAAVAAAAAAAVDANEASRERAELLLTSSSGELSRSCRICLMGDNGEPLVSPCKCRGSMGMVHLSCLERWLSQHSRNYCELCLFEFPVTRIPRYSVARSLRLWFCHPRVRQSLMEDLLVLAALTFVVAGIVAVCLLGLQYFTAEGLKLGISRAYTVAVISSFMALVLLGYFVIVCLLVRDLIVPWHVWWRRCAVVRIILD